jgi:hypothetical protein
VECFSRQNRGFSIELKNLFYRDYVEHIGNLLQFFWKILSIRGQHFNNLCYIHYISIMLYVSSKISQLGSCSENQDVLTTHHKKNKIERKNQFRFKYQITSKIRGHPSVVDSKKEPLTVGILLWWDVRRQFTVSASVTGTFKLFQNQKMPQQPSIDSHPPSLLKYIHKQTCWLWSFPVGKPHSSAKCAGCCCSLSNLFTSWKQRKIHS